MGRIARQRQFKRFAAMLTLVVMLIVVLFLSVVPEPAFTVSWSVEPIPSTDDYVLFPGSDIADLTVTWDGTIYAVTGNDAYCYRSTTEGLTWSQLNMNFGATLRFVEVAPDDPDFFVVASGTTVWYTPNDGTTWFSLGRPNGIDAINDIALSVEKNGNHFVAAAGEDGGNAEVWTYEIGASGATWQNQSTEATFSTGEIALAVEFSPNFYSDQVIVAIVGDTGANTIEFQIYSFNTDEWNSGAFAAYPVNLVQASETFSTLNSASIVMAPDYLGSDDAMRLVFVGLTVDSGTAMKTSGIFRLDDDDVDVLKGEKEIHSVDFDGMNLIAGAYDTNRVFHSSDPLVSSPTVNSSNSVKSPGGVNRTIVAFVGENVVAGTSGDESALAISKDNGGNFNDISLIDTAITKMEDIAVSADGNKVYLATNDGTDLSLWRRVSSWERVLSRPSNTGYIVRIAPENSDAVYVAKRNSITLYHTRDGGERWLIRNTKYDFQDMAVENADVAYIALYNQTAVSKTTNGGFTWSTPQSTGLTVNIHMIRSLGRDRVIVGSVDGYVAWSTDGNVTWNWIDTKLNGSGDVHVTASGLANGDYIYAATATAATKVERWQIGSSTAWEDMMAPTTGNFRAYGIELHEGALYVANSDRKANSEILRALNPSTNMVAWGTIASLGTTFTTEPSALRVSTGSTKLWAIDNLGPLLASYTDFMPDITVSPSPMDFGSPVAGSSSSPLTITVTNTGTADLTISTITIGGANADQFSIQNDSCSGQTIAPASSATLEVVFNPTSIDIKSATLSIPSDDPDEATVGVALTGIGTPDILPEIEVSVSPDTPPTTEDKISITFAVTDSSGIERIEIFENTVKVFQYPTLPCTYIGGPYPEGIVTYEVDIYITAEMYAKTGYLRYKRFAIDIPILPAPKPQLPDLAPLNIGWKVDKEDRLLIIIVQVGNVGDAGVPRTVVQARTPVAEWAAEAVVPELNAGNSAEALIKLAISDELWGRSYSFQVGVDPRNEINEQREDNNWQDIHVIVPPEPLTPPEQELKPEPEPKPEAGPDVIQIVWKVTAGVAGGAAAIGFAMGLRHFIKVRQAARIHQYKKWQEQAKEEKSPEEEESTEPCEPCHHETRYKKLELEPALHKIKHISLSACNPVSHEQRKEEQVRDSIVDGLNKVVTARCRGEKTEKLQEQTTRLSHKLLQQIIEWLDGESIAQDIFIVGHLAGDKITCQYTRYHCKRRGVVSIWVEEKKWKDTVEVKRDVSVGTLHNLDPTNKEALDKCASNLTLLLIQFIKQV